MQAAQGLLTRWSCGDERPRQQVSGVTQSFDPLTSERILELKGSSANPSSSGTSRTMDRTCRPLRSRRDGADRPDELRLVQQPERLIYEASAPIETITYGGQDGDQRNALFGGPSSEFELVLGSEVGYVASTPIQSVEIQSSNATVPLTMDGRFSVDGDETSFCRDLTCFACAASLLWRGALGPEGNSRVEMQRTSSHRSGCCLGAQHAKTPCWD